VTDISVTGWDDLHHQLFDGAWDQTLQRFRSRHVFRGVSDASYRLHTTLFRLGGSYERLERNLLRNFRKYAHRDAAAGDSIWNWLAVAQHHGLPTRLLDWTYSPHAALHFATAGVQRGTVDGAIWCVNYIEVHRLLPPPLHDLLLQEGSNVFTTDMLQVAAHSLAEFDQLGVQPFVLFFEPPSLDDRVVNQSALFSVMSSAHGVLDEWLEQHKSPVRKIIVPAELKWEIRDKLDELNITERVMFPGLDGLSAWLARYYGPRHAQPG